MDLAFDLLLSSFESFPKLIWGSYLGLIHLRFYPGFLFCLFGQAVNAARTVYKNNCDKKLFWLHSLVLTFATGFIGGFIAPLLIGKPPIFYNNDYIVLMVIGAWYAMNYLNAVSLFDLYFMRMVISIALALFRTHTIIKMTLAANAVIPGNVYNVAIMGPILTPMVLATAGMFVPQRGTGFEAISKEVPWGMQGAFISSSFAHFMLNDTNGKIGNLLRSVVGTYSESQVITIIGTMHLVTNLGQLLLEDSRFNCFSLIHRFFYMLSGVYVKTDKNKEPTMSTLRVPLSWRVKIEKNFVVFRTSVLFAVVAILAQRNVNARHLFAGFTNGMKVNGKGLTVCGFLPSIRGCSTYSMQLTHADGAYDLAVSGPGDTKKLFKASVKGDYSCGVKAMLDDDGSFKIRSSDGKVMWSNGKACKVNDPAKPNYFYLGTNGTPTVYCHVDGSTITF